MIREFCKKDTRIPIEYRTDKDKALSLLKKIVKKNIKIENKDIYSLASWVGFNIGRYTIADVFCEVEKIEYIGEKPTYDMHIKNGNSYVANGIICHNTVNLPEDVTIEEVAEIYQTAWEAGCKGVTVYRKNCRSGVLVEKRKDEDNKIKYSDAPKRPKELGCDIYHVSVKGNPFFVLVGKMYGEPYEVFAGDGNGKVIPKTMKSGIVKKMGRGKYALCDPINIEEYIHKDISTYIGEDYETITRLVSSNLRHGCNVSFITHQLEKTSGDLMSFSKAIARVLKKYIKDGTAVSGEECPECGSELMRKDGCVQCSCGWTKC